MTILSWTGGSPFNDLIERRPRLCATVKTGGVITVSLALLAAVILAHFYVPYLDGALAVPFAAVLLSSLVSYIRDETAQHGPRETLPLVGCIAGIAAAPLMGLLFYATSTPLSGSVESTVQANMDGFMAVVITGVFGSLVLVLLIVGIQQVLAARAVLGNLTFSALLAIVAAGALECVYLFSGPLQITGALLLLFAASPSFRAAAMKLIPNLDIPARGRPISLGLFVAGPVAAAAALYFCNFPEPAYVKTKAAMATINVIVLVGCYVAAWMLSMLFEMILAVVSSIYAHYYPICIGPAATSVSTVYGEEAALSVPAAGEIQPHAGIAPDQVLPSLLASLETSGELDDRQGLAIAAMQAAEDDGSRDAADAAMVAAGVPLLWRALALENYRSRTLERMLLASRPAA